MAVCPAIDPQIGTAQTMLQAMDCHVGASVAQSYGALLGPGGGLRDALTAALVIYVAVLGYRFILGRSRLSMGDLVPRMLLIGAVLALTTSWATYQTLVYNVLTDGPDELAQMVAREPDASRSVAVRVDRVSKQLTDAANDWGKGPLGIVAAAGPQSSIAEAANAAREQAAAAGTAPVAASSPAPAITGGNPFSSAPNYLSWSAMLLTLTAAGSIAIAKALLGLLLALGPAFALLALFASTRGLALGWARAALFLAFVPLLATLTSLAMLTMLEPMAARLASDAALGVYSLNVALAIFTAVLVMTGIALLAVRVATMMVSGWVIGLQDQMAATRHDPLHASHIEMSGYGAAAGAGSGKLAGADPSRLDQIVLAIERSNTSHPPLTVQHRETRALEFGVQQRLRPASNQESRQIALRRPITPAIQPASPLRPARAWS